MAETRHLKEYDTQFNCTKTNVQSNQGAEIEDFWQPGTRVWSDRPLSGNRIMRIHGVVTGTLTRFMVPAASHKSPVVPSLVVPSLRVRVHWDGLESEALLDPSELVPYNQLKNLPGSTPGISQI